MLLMGKSTISMGHFPVRKLLVYQRVQRISADPSQRSGQMFFRKNNQRKPWVFSQLLAGRFPMPTQTTRNHTMAVTTYGEESLTWLALGEHHA